MDQESIVRYWHAVELLQPQSAPKLKKRSNRYEAFIHDTPIQRPLLPWTPESIVSEQELPKKRIWSHTLYAHLYDSRLVAEKLDAMYGADQGYQEPKFRESAVFAAKFTAGGRLVDDSFVLSSEAWFLGRVLTGKDWTRDGLINATGKRSNRIRRAEGAQIADFLPVSAVCGVLPGLQAQL
ncbi:hypothetical protein NX05_23840, partial [Xanthomonas vasicola]